MLEKIFDMENPLMRTLSVAADLIVLNLAAILCSLPVLTWGAAYTALNDVVWHIVCHREGYILKSFFRSFAGNFKRGSLLGIIFLMAGGILGVDMYALRQAGAPFRLIIFALAFLGLMVAILSFALLSRYENSVFLTMKNAAALVIGFFPRCLCMLLFSLGFLAAMIVFRYFIFPLILLFGLSLPCYVNALFYVGIFEKLEGTKLMEDGPLDEAELTD